MIITSNIMMFYKGLFFSLQREALGRVSTVIWSFFFMKRVARTSNILFHITRKKNNCWNERLLLSQKLSLVFAHWMMIRRNKMSPLSDYINVSVISSIEIHLLEELSTVVRVLQIFFQVIYRINFKLFWGKEQIFQSSVG